MKHFKVISCSLSGLACGAVAAWVLHHGSESRGREAGPSSLAGLPPPTGVPGAWASLTTAGGQGLSAHLAQADLISRAAVGDIPRLLELAGRDPLTRELLLRRWAELDPAGAAAWLAPLMRSGEWPGPEGREKDVEIVFSVWAQKAPAAAMAAVKANSPPGVNTLYAASILTRLMAVDMAAGVRFGALTGSSMTLSRIFYNTGSMKWTQEDPAKAANLLSPLPPGEFRDRSLLSAINALAKTDPPAAIALREKFPALMTGVDGRWTMDDFYSTWAATDREGMMVFLNDKAGLFERPAMKVAIAKSLAGSDPRTALDWSAANLSGRDRTEAVNAILSGLGKDNPAAALDYLNSLSPGTALNSAVESFVKSLPPDDSGAAMAMAETLPAGAAREALTAKAWEIGYAQDPEAVLRRIASQSAGSLPNGIWGQLGARTGSIAEGMGRIGSIPPEAATEFVQGLFRGHIGMNSALETFTGAVATLTEPAFRKAAIETSLGRQLWRNPAAVTQWALTLPDDERGLVADQMEKNLFYLTPAERREVIAPLRP